MFHHRFRGKFLPYAKKNRNYLDDTSLASSGDFHLGFIAATMETTRLCIKFMI